MWWTQTNEHHRNTHTNTTEHPKNEWEQSFENKNKDFVQNLSGILLVLLITISCNDYSKLCRLETPEYKLPMSSKPVWGHSKTIWLL